MIDGWQDLAPGDKPTWLAAIFAGGAFFFTAWTLARNEGDRRRRERDAEGEQARYVRVSQVKSGRARGHRDDGFLDIPMSFTVNNESSDAIHDLRIQMSVEPPDSALENGVLDETRTLFASGHWEEFELTPRIPLVGDSLSEPVAFDAAPVVEFTDIHKRRWRRDRDYRLTQIKQQK